MFESISKLANKTKKMIMFESMSKLANKTNKKNDSTKSKHHDQYCVKKKTIKRDRDFPLFFN